MRTKLDNLMRELRELQATSPAARMLAQPPPLARKLPSTASAKRLVRPAATTPQAPAKAPSKTPLADKLASLTGAEKTLFYRDNETALKCEQLTAQNPKVITPLTTK
jgi:hypothetical protein